MNSTRSRHVIDAYAWVEYLRGTERGKKVRDLLDSGESYTPAVTLAEVVSKVERAGEDTAIARRAIHSLSMIVDIDGGFASEAGELHARLRKTKKDIGLADCFIAATAKRLNAKIVTGDQHFKGLKDVIFI